MAALAVALLVTLLFGLLVAFSGRATCSVGDVEVACPTDPVGPHGQAVSDQFYFAHQPLGTNGAITVRMTSITGIITHPPPDHDDIVPGLVPWAKAGIMIKDGVTPGSSYAALMVTGDHGVRLQHDYVHDTAGRPGGVSPQEPRWLRLTRAGEVVTAHESTDGRTWTTVGTARLAGLPETVQVGLFATSPGDLTPGTTDLGTNTAAIRFTQTSATFDNVTVSGATDAAWRGEAVGTMGDTDWERKHRAPGFARSGGTFTVIGSGDVGPVGTVGGHPVERTLMGLALGLVLVIAVAARFATRRRGDGTATLAGDALVVGAASFVFGLGAAGLALPLGRAVLRSMGSTVLPTSFPTDLGVVAGAACLTGVVAVLALAIAALLGRAWAAVLVAVAAVVVPYVLAVAPLLPDDAARWLLRLTPAAGFSVTQTLREFPQVLAHYAPSTGYFPLPGWSGFAVLCGYTAVLLGLTAVLARRRHTTPAP